MKITMVDFQQHMSMCHSMLIQKISGSISIDEILVVGLVLSSV